MIDVDSVRERIESAFADVRFPKDKLLLHPRSQDEYEIRDFKGKNWQKWQDVPKEIIDYNHCSLPFFSSSALIFLLPAYMMVSLDDLTTNTFLFTLFALMPNQNSGEPNPTKYFLDWADRLTPEQKAAITLFLEYVEQEEEEPDSESNFALQALQSYWKNSDR
jgi:hypothetical protein